MRSAGDEKQPQFSILPEYIEGFVSGSTNFIAKRHNGTEIPLFNVMVVSTNGVSDHSIYSEYDSAEDIVFPLHSVSIL